MIKLRVLGGIALQSEMGDDLRAVTAQPKRVALLAYLALASRRAPVRRDTVLGLFWPELDAERARRALRQAIYHLRQELGSDALEGNGDDILQVKPDLLWCDAVEFADAIEARAHERALDLYKGELLPGFYITGAPEFEQWLSVERQSMQQQALSAAAALASGAHEVGRKEEVVRWSLVAHQLAPFDEQVLRRLLDALVAVGDPARAVLTFEQFAHMLEKELGVSPAPETAAVIEQVRAQATATSSHRKRWSLTSHGAVASSSIELRVSRPRWGLPIITAAVVGLFIVTGIVTALVHNSNKPLDPHLIAITPFRVLGSISDSVVLADGIPELLSLNVEAEYGPRIVDSRAIWNRWRDALAAGGRSAPELARNVARAAGAGLVLTGSVLPRGETTVMTAALVDVETGDIKAKASVEGPSEQIIQSVGKLGAKVLATFLMEDPARMQQLSGTPLEAVQAYLEGKAAGRRGEYDVAFALLNRALEIDSTFALAALALVDVGGWSARGQVNYERIAYRHRDRLGVRDQAYLYGWIGTSDTTRDTSTGDLLRESMRALRVVPDRPEVYYLVGDRFYHTGRLLGYDDAARRSLANFEHALRLDPDFAPAREHLIELSVELRDVALTRKYRELMMRTESGPRMPYLRWTAAQLLRDASEMQITRAAFDTMPSLSLSNIQIRAQEEGMGLDDADYAMKVLLARATTNEEAAHRKDQAEALWRNRGRYALADSIKPYAPVTPQTPLPALVRILSAAAFRDVTPKGTQAALTELMRRANGEARNEAETAAKLRARYFLEVWNLLHHDSSTIAESLPMLRVLPALGNERIGSQAPISSQQMMRIAILEALLEHMRAGSASLARPKTLLLDSLARDVAAQEQMVLANNVLTHIHGEAGDYQRAYDASRRHVRYATLYLATDLRNEARFAAAAGRRSQALRAYEHYLALRTDPDPVLRAQLDSVRVEYARVKRSR